MQHQKVLSTQQQATKSLSSASIKKQWRLAEQYNNSLIGQPVKDPFVEGSGAIVPKNYDAILNVNHDGVMGEIKIPKIKVDLPIGHGTDDKTLEDGAGHTRQTSLPIGGSSTHSLIIAHRGLPRAEMFTRLDELQLGDVFTITVLDKTLTYQIDKISVVDPDDLSQISIIKGRDLVTLMTCTPYGVNTQRLLVRGTRIPNQSVANTVQPSVTSMGLEGWARIIGLIIGVVSLLVLMITIIRRIRSRHKTTSK
jgi:sortase A